VEPEDWTKVANLGELINGQSAQLKRHLAHALWAAKQPVQVSLGGLKERVPLEGGDGRTLPMAAKSVLTKAVVRLNPPPPPGMPVTIALQVHNGRTGLPLSAGELAGLPVFLPEAREAGDSNTLYAQIGASGESHQMGFKLGFTGQLLMTGGRQQPFFLRATVVKGGEPVHGDSELFGVRARKSDRKEDAKKAAFWGLSPPEAENEAEGAPRPKRSKHAAKPVFMRPPPPPPTLAPVPPPPTLVPAPLLPALPPAAAVAAAPAKPPAKMPQLPKPPAKIPQPPKPAPPPVAPELDECAQGFAMLAAEDAADAAAEDAANAAARCAGLF
jgi:hypothetical protein